MELIYAFLILTSLIGPYSLTSSGYIDHRVRHMNPVDYRIGRNDIVGIGADGTARIIYRDGCKKELKNIEAKPR